MRLVPTSAVPVALAVLVAGLSGCGSGTQAPAPAVTVTQAAPTVIETAKPSASDAATPADAAQKKRLPNVVGKNLQAAQDTMQAAGFYLLSDKDATGQGRFQVYDRNWVVVRQTPAAGRRVALSTLVTLWAKKIGE
jgi:beta-lactam-binding protein with PASTA domain